MRPISEQPRRPALVRWALVSAVLAVPAAGLAVPRWAAAGDATTEQPVATTEPAVATTEPPVATTEPPVETSEPAVPTTEPAVETSEPLVETTEPPVATTDPPVATTDPPVAMTEPAVESSEPLVETTEPPVETTEPVVEATESAVATTDPPPETSEPPADTVAEPAAVTATRAAVSEPASTTTTTAATDPPRSTASRTALPRPAATDANTTATTTTTTATTATTTTTEPAGILPAVGTAEPNIGVLAALPATEPVHPWGVDASAGNEVVNLTWNAPVADGGAPVLAYRVQRSTNATDWFTFAWIPATTRQLIAFGLENDTTYFFRVTAVNEVGASAPSWWSSARPSASVEGLPINAGGLDLGAGNEVAYLTWDAPAYDVGGPVRTYRVQRSTNARDWTTFAWVPASPRALRITDLENGSRYFFRVLAVNVNGAGAPSWWASGITSAADNPYVPIHPWGLRTTVDSGQVTVRWNAPADGPKALAYRVQIAADPSGGWSTAAWVPASAPRATLTGLVDGMTYYLRVIAVNLYGAGAPSWWTTATPDAPPPDPGTPPSDPDTPPSEPDAPPIPAGFPTASSVGVPPDWEPVRTIDGDFVVTQPGAVVQDLRINGALIINAPNVTVRRVEVVGGQVSNWQDDCHDGLVIEDTTIRRGDATTTGDQPAIGSGGYTARRVLIDGLPEGFRIQGGAECGPVVIERSYARVVAPDVCVDWHGDALQGYGGDAVTVRDSVLELVERSGCGGTAAFFYPDQGNTSAQVDGLVVMGGGYPFRLGTPGSIERLYIVEDSWTFGPIDVRCQLLSAWQAFIARLPGGQPVVSRPQPCNFESPN